MCRAEERSLLGCSHGGNNDEISFRILYRVALVRTVVSKAHIASSLRGRKTRSSIILKIEAKCSSETSVHTTATRRHSPWNSEALNPRTTRQAKDAVSHPEKGSAKGIKLIRVVEIFYRFLFCG
jgi:hypothetical protein